MSDHEADNRQQRLMGRPDSKLEVCYRGEIRPQLLGSPPPPPGAILTWKIRLPLASASRQGRYDRRQQNRFRGYLAAESLGSEVILGRAVSAERNGRVLCFRERPPAIDRWLARWQLRSTDLRESAPARAFDRARRLLLNLRAATLWARAAG